MRKTLSITAGILFLLFSTFALFFSGVWILEALEIIAKTENGVTTLIQEIIGGNPVYIYIITAVMAFLGFEFSFGVISCGANVKKYKKSQWISVVSLIIMILDIAILTFLCIKLSTDSNLWLYIVADVILAISFLFVLIDLISLRNYFIDEATMGKNNVDERELSVEKIIEDKEKQMQATEPKQEEPQKQEPLKTHKTVSELEQRINEIMELGAKQEQELKAIDAKREASKNNEHIDVVLSRYIKMRDSGAISQAEFDELKKSLIEKEKKVD